MEEGVTLSVQCLFCMSEQFEVPSENYEPQHGDLIKCANCGRLNDYDSMWRVVRRKGEELAEDQAQAMLDDFSKDLNKLFR